MGFTQTLAATSPFAATKKNGRTQTVCGGIMAWTLLPAALVVYAGWWLNGWYGGGNLSLRSRAPCGIRR